MMDKIYIFGAGKIAVSFLYEYSDEIKVEGFFDNDPDSCFPIKGVNRCSLLERDPNKKIVICTNVPNYLEIKNQLESLGCVEWQDYIYFRFYKKKLVALIGNCHVLTIKKMLRLNSDFNKHYGIYEMPPICDITEEKKADYERSIVNADVVIHQDIRRDNSLGVEFSEDYVRGRIKDECIYIKMINTYGLGRI